MPGILKSNERLVCVGTTALRAPDGTPLENVPRYMSVPADKADPASVAVLRENERLIMAGTLHTDRQAAEERFAAALEGRANPYADGTPLYIKEATENKNKNGLSAGEIKACDLLVDELIAAFVSVADNDEHTSGAISGGVVNEK